MQIKSIIIDDEKNSRENLSGLLEAYCKNVTVVAEADSVITGIDAIKQHKPNLVFLDIEMPGGNGFKLLEYFKEIFFEVIFVTAYDHYALRAIKFSALDYILKPINTLELKASIEKMQEKLRLTEKNKRLQSFVENMNTSNLEKKIALPNNDKIEFTPVNQIVRLEADSNYSKIYLSDSTKLLIAKTLFEFEEILAEYNFLRTHKTHLVNLNHVKSFMKNDGGFVVMTDGFQVPVSRRKKEMVLERLKGI